MRKIWIILCIVCFATVGCNNEIPTQIEDPSETNMLKETTAVGREEAFIPEETTMMTETEPSSNEGSGGYIPCIHSVRPYGVSNDSLEFSYHTLSDYLVNYVGYDALMEWANDEEQKAEWQAEYERGERGCPTWTIVDFVEDFQISRECFELLALYQPYYTDYNVDVIYSGIKAAEEYYTRERTQEALAREIAHMMKLELFQYVQENKLDEYNTWVSKKNTDGWIGTDLLAKASEHLTRATCDNAFKEKLGSFIPTDLRLWSMVEFIDVFDIPRDVVDKIHAKYKNYCGYKGTVNIDGLFTKTRDASCYRNTAADLIDMQYFIFEEENAVVE